MRPNAAAVVLVMGVVMAACGSASSPGVDYPNLITVNG